MTDDVIDEFSGQFPYANFDLAYVTKALRDAAGAPEEGFQFSGVPVRRVSMGMNRSRPDEAEIEVSYGLPKVQTVTIRWGGPRCDDKIVVEIRRGDK